MNYAALLRGLTLKLKAVNCVVSAALDRKVIGALDLVTLNKALGNGNLEDGANLGSGEVRGYSGPNVGHGSALDGLDERGNIAVKRREVRETLRIVGLADGRLAVVERVELGSSLLDGSGALSPKIAARVSTSALAMAEKKDLSVKLVMVVPFCLKNYGGSKGYQGLACVCPFFSPRIPLTIITIL